MWESDPSSKISSPERQMGLCFSLGMSFTCKSWRDLVAQMVKCLPTMWETQVQSLGWEDPLEREMAPYSSILAWKIPWTEEPGRLSSLGSQRATWASLGIQMSDFTFLENRGSPPLSTFLPFPIALSSSFFLLAMSPSDI